MNSTYNYSFLFDNDANQSYQHLAFIPTDVISEKYTKKASNDSINSHLEALQAYKK